MIKQEPYTILFIEDEDDTRENYVRYLKRYFIDVYEAIDGEEALKIYRDKKPNILIIDINLPKISGIELLQIIREKDHTTKALMLTAHSTTDFLLKASELKLTKYLLKPITRDELKDALNSTINELNRFNVIAKEIFVLKENYIWNYAQKRLLKDNIEIQLTIQESKILDLLFNNINKDISFQDMIIYIWSNFEKDKLNSLKIAIKRVRKKLPQDTIINVYGFGYKIIQ